MSSIIPQREVAPSAGQAFGECVLSVNTGTVIGVLVGTAYTVFRGRRNFRAFIGCSAIGTISDLYYGYNYQCADLRRKFEQAQAKAKPN